MGMSGSWGEATFARLVVWLCDGLHLHVLIVGCVAFVEHVHGYVRRLTDR